MHFYFLSKKARYLTTQAKDDPIRYIHNEIGFNYRLTNIQAAIGVGQFEMLESFLEKKKEIYQFYLSNINDNNGYTYFEDGSKVYSKARRLIRFDSNIKHSGTTHTDAKHRFVININYIPKEMITYEKVQA